jgi:hypothetical protein
VYDSTGSRRGLLRVGLVVLLLVGAFFVALPWLGCVMSARPGLNAPWGFCTISMLPFLPSNEANIPGFTGPYWGNLILGIVYLVAAVYVALTKRPS